MDFGTDRSAPQTQIPSGIRMCQHRRQQYTMLLLFLSFSKRGQNIPNATTPAAGFRAVNRQGLLKSTNQMSEEEVPMTRRSQPAGKIKMVSHI